MNNIQKLVEMRQSLYKIVMDLMKASGLKTLNDFYKYCKFTKKEKSYTTLIAVYCPRNTKIELLYDGVQGKEISFTEELNLIKKCTQKITRTHNF